MRTLNIGVVSRFKQGDLLAVMQERGWSQSELGRFLGMIPKTIGDLLNFNNIPRKLNFTPEVERKLLELTGKLPDDLWPQEVRRRKTAPVASYKEVPLAALGPGASLAALPPAQEDAVFDSELKGLIWDALESLPRRTALIVKRRFIDEKNLDEVGAELGVGRERVRQIESKALRLLWERHWSYDKEAGRRSVDKSHPAERLRSAYECMLGRELGQ